MSPAIQGDYISDLDAIQTITQLAGGLFELDMLAGSVAGGYVSRRVTTEQWVAYLATQGLGGPLSGFQTVRFRTRAEASAPGAYGGAVLEELDYSSLFTYARVFVEFWRDDPTNLNERPRSQELIAVYDPNADAAHMGYATSGGPAAGVSRLGLKLVLLSDPAATGVLQYDAGQPVMQGQPRYYDDGQGVKFYEALQDMLPPVPAPVRGTVTAYWKPIDYPPVPGGSGGQPAASLYYSIADAIAGRDNNTLPEGRPTVAIPDAWNGAGDSIVYLEVEEANRWARYGQLLDAAGNWSFVEVDLDNATAVSYAQLSRRLTRQQAYDAQLAGQLSPGSYVVTGPWNGQPGGVAMIPLAGDLMSPLGALNVGGNPELVIANLQAGTYELFSVYVARMGGGGSTATRDPYDVDTAKRKQVVDANVPFLKEPDSAYYGKKILNRTYAPTRPATYDCIADAPLVEKNPDGSINPTTWWWVRTPIA